MFDLLQQIDVNFILGGIALLIGALFLFLIFRTGKSETKKYAVIIFICAFAGVAFLIVGQFNTDYVSLVDKKVQYEVLAQGLPLCYEIAENDSSISPMLNKGAQMIFKDAQFDYVCCSDKITDFAHLNFDIKNKTGPSQSYTVDFSIYDLDIYKSEFILRANTGDKAMTQ